MADFLFINELLFSLSLSLFLLLNETSRRKELSFSSHPHNRKRTKHHQQPHRRQRPKSKKKNRAERLKNKFKEAKIAEKFDTTIQAQDSI